MSLDLTRTDAEPLTSIDTLVEGFREAEKPAAEHRLGLEHEKLIYPVNGGPAPAYEGAQGIGALLAELEKEGGYAPFREGPGGPVIALQRGMAAISLEPGGQVELSGSPFRSAREAHAENLAHLAEVKRSAQALGLLPVGLGYRPFDALSGMPFMPKQRYEMMRKSLPQRGPMALNMMLMTATGQVSLDWSSEADCVRKVQLTARLSPLLVALYANSPLVEGKPVGFASFRNHVWSGVDNSRCGYLPAFFDGSFSYRAYVEWALDAPLLFLRRRGAYLHPSLTFRQLLAEGFEGKPAELADWTDHLSTLFPEVRLKKVMEVRSADCGSAEMTGALPALMRGLLYDAVASDEAEQLLPRLSYQDHVAWHAAAAREGLSGKGGAHAFQPLAQELVLIAQRGLRRLDAQDAALLDPLAEIVQGGESPSAQVLRAWKEDPRPQALYARFAL